MRIDLGRGARALRAVLRGLCEAFPGSLGLASHDLPGSRGRALIFNMRALEREDSMDFRVPALGRGGQDLPLGFGSLTSVRHSVKIR